MAGRKFDKYNLEIRHRFTVKVINYWEVMKSLCHHIKTKELSKRQASVKSKLWNQCNWLKCYGRYYTGTQAK